jgi:L-malate glycosyltransferase
MKKKIVHFIFNLGRGGAETMMVRVIKELPEYDHVVVTLFPLDDFGNELQCNKLICLNLGSLFSVPLAILRFRKLVIKEKADLVHTHLFWPTIIARLAVPRKIPVVTTIHAFIKTSVEYRNWHVRFLDRITYKFRKNIIIVVARGAMEEYFSLLNLKPYKAYVLYTFVDVNRFNVHTIDAGKVPGPFRLISVGALRRQKNYSYLIEAMSLLKDKPIELDIYGVGIDDTPALLQQQIETMGSKVVLKGQVSNIQQIIPNYDLFVMSSTFEGFSLSTLEAMAMRMPLLLSDISSFREQCEDNAWYFPLSDANELADKIISLSKTDKSVLYEKAEAGRQRAIGNFTLEQHIAGLRNIYTDAMALHN